MAQSHLPVKFAPGWQKTYLFIVLSFLLKAQQDFAKKKKDLEAKYEKQLVSDGCEGGEVFSLEVNKFSEWPWFGISTSDGNVFNTAHIT